MACRMSALVGSSSSTSSWIRRGRCGRGVERGRDEVDRLGGVDLALRELGQRGRRGDGGRATVRGDVDGAHPLGDGVGELAGGVDDLVELQVRCRGSSCRRRSSAPACPTRCRSIRSTWICCRLSASCWDALNGGRDSWTAVSDVESVLVMEEPFSVVMSRFSHSNWNDSSKGRLPSVVPDGGANLEENLSGSSARPRGPVRRAAEDRSIEPWGTVRHRVGTRGKERDRRADRSLRRYARRRSGRSSRRSGVRGDGCTAASRGAGRDCRGASRTGSSGGWASGTGRQVRRARSR